jgi:hypothetical protein
MSSHYGDLTQGLALVLMGGVFFYFGFLKKKKSRFFKRPSKKRVFLKILAPALILSGVLIMVRGGPHTHFPWKRYDFKEGGFSAIFPGPPESTVDKKKEGEFEFVEYKLHFGIQEPAYDFRVVVTPIPPQVDFSLQKVEENLSSGASMKLLNRKLISVEGRPGVDILLKTGEGFDVKTRIYVLDGKYYQIIAVASEEALQAKEIDDFFNSVKPLSAS